MAASPQLAAAIQAPEKGESARMQGRYAAASASYEKALAMVKNLPVSTQALGAVANNLGAAYQDEGRYKDAQGAYSFALRVQSAPADTSIRAVTLANEASLLDFEGDYQRAESVFEQALAIQQSRSASDAGSLARTLNNFGVLRHDEGDNRDAEKKLLAALAIRKTLGVQSEIAETTDNLGNVYRATGRYDLAKLSYENARDLRGAALGVDHPDYAGSLNDLADYYRGQYDYRACGPLYEKAAAIWRAKLSATNPIIGGIDKNLAALYDGEGDYGRAEEFYRLALEVRHTALGDNHPLYAASLRNLATFYADQERYDLALPLYQRALDIERAMLPQDDPDLSATKVSMGGVYRSMRRYKDAEDMYGQALETLRRTMGPDHVMVATGMSDLGEIYRDENRLTDAEREMVGALDIRRKQLGPNHPDVARSETELADFYESRRQFPAADHLLRDALRIHQGIPGGEQVDIARVTGDLAYVLAQEGSVPQARALFEQARRTMVEVQHANAGIDDEAMRGLLASERSLLAHYAELLAEVAATPSLDPGGPPPTDEAFVVVEQAKNTAAQAALALAATRWASTNRNAAELVSVVQALRNRRRALARAIASAAGKSQSPHVAGVLDPLLAEATDVDRRLASTSALLLSTFPKYAEIATPNPIGLKEATALLEPDEAMVTFFTLNKGVMAWFLRSGHSPIYRQLPIARSQLNAAIARLRRSIWPGKPHSIVAAYDVIDAYALYQALLQPFKANLEGVKHLIIVPDEVLVPVPFAALVTSDQSSAFAHLADDYRSGATPSPEHLRDDYPQIAWLAKESYATSEVPSATALGVLRTGSARRTALLKDGDSGSLRLIGIGDPTLHGRCGGDRGGDMVADDLEVVVDAVRDLPRLCGAREELVTEATALDAPANTSLYMENRATKPEVMNLNRFELRRARVVVFATHALIGGTASAAREPALVMTPPAIPTLDDHGLLTLTDILDLRLDRADWVILSACDTFRADGSGEGFSGLVRAFFHTGSSSILASQWSVNDQATRQLITRVLAAYAQTTLPPAGFRRALAALGMYALPRTSRAEALRQGALALITGEHSPQQLFFSHPFAWASFVVVGEGGPVLGK